MWAMGECFACHRVFTFNAVRVPSIRALNGRPDQRGKAEPICRHCVERINPTRIANGLPPIQIPAGAYAPEGIL